MSPVVTHERTDAPRTGPTPEGQADGPRQGNMGVHEQAQSVRAVFSQVEDGYAAVGRLRATGFRIDLAGSTEGDLIVTIQAERSRFDELTATVAAHQGRIETEAQGSARKEPA